MASLQELVGDVYLIDRTVSPLPLLGGTKVARLGEMLRYNLEADVQIGRKGNNAPSWARVNGDWIEMMATFVETSDEFFKIATQNRNATDSFSPEDGATYRRGKLLTDAHYVALVVRDTKNPLDYPALYIPYALCIHKGWFAARAGKHAEFVQMEIISMDYDTDVKPYEYGDISTFDGYEAEA